MSVVATIIDGVFQDLSIRSDATQVESAEELDRLIGALSLVVLEAKDLSRESRRRLAQFFYAAGEMVSERTRLDAGDQKVFDTHLREMAARKFGV